ncbi:MAG: type II toxin-antitoxin system HicB family antitoxin [Prochloron sp. SP5CPC1]|nr:type II toxin-antitoxin system HicB family antitoxin [Candidatus Paraprochloron terpiosi SP5CPC1]
MEKKKFIYWQEDDMWLGYLEEYPDYWTQGETEAELRENLLDIYKDLTSGAVFPVRRFVAGDRLVGFRSSTQPTIKRKFSLRLCASA